MVDFLPIVLLLSLVLLVICQVAIVVYLQVSQRDFFNRIAKLLNLPEQERQSWDVWHRVMRKKEAILGEAELEGVKIVAGSKYYIKELEGVYENQLRQAAERMEKEYHQFLMDLEEENRREIAENNKQVFDQTNKVLAQFTKSLEEKLPKVGEETLDLVFQETQKAKLDLEKYKKTVIDQTQKNLTAAIEEVAKVVLGKGIAVEDQMDLITQAFERAKKERFVS